MPTPYEPEITQETSLEERKKRRPANYNELSPLHRWEVDADLGIWTKDDVAEKVRTFDKKKKHHHHRH